MVAVESTKDEPLVKRAEKKVVEKRKHQKHGQMRKQKGGCKGKERVQKQRKCKKLVKSDTNQQTSKESKEGRAGIVKRSG